MSRKRRTIREYALKHLCKIDYWEDRREDPSPDNRVSLRASHARSVGVPYDKILTAVKRSFPDCRTNIASLRWYAVKVRVGEEGYEGWHLPQRRPRVRKKRS